MRSPKLRRFALRSFVTSENFLTRRNASPACSTFKTREQLGDALARGIDFGSSENLSLAVAALRGLVDRSTKNSQPGAQLMFPFHESLLWYDARESATVGWDVRKVAMRGTGITLARLLCGSEFGEHREKAVTIRDAVRLALTNNNGVARVARSIESLDALEKAVVPQADERESWRLAEKVELVPLGTRLRTAGADLMTADAIAFPSRLWALRNLLALEVALHILRRAYQVAGTSNEQQYLVVCVGGPRRPENFSRQASELSLEHARRTIREALVETIAETIVRLRIEKDIAWNQEFEKRSKLDDLSERLGDASESALDLAREIFERGTYERTDDAFRRLLNSIGILGGSGAYRYIEGTPDLLSLLVYALSSEMPLTSREFFATVYKRWGLVLSADSVAYTDLGAKIDSSDLARNGRRVEQMLVYSGLAQSYSDSTTMVGNRIRQAAHKYE